MIIEMMQYYGLTKELKNAGYFVDESYGPMFEDLKKYMPSGDLIALTGPIGVGKTSSLHRIMIDLEKEGNILVVSSLSIDKNKVNLNTLIDAMVADLADEDTITLHKRTELRMRQIQKLITRRNVPVAIFIDEEHDLPMQTLIELKRLMELISKAGGRLAIVLVGHPRLKFELHRASMQEIGMRTQHVIMKGIDGCEEKFFDWMLSSCLEPNVKISDIFTAGARKALISKLKTPLEMECYTWRVLSEGYLTAEKPISENTVCDVIGKNFDSLESRLTRQGYPIGRLSESIGVSVSEIKDYQKGRLPAGRAHEIDEELTHLGITIGATR
nr:AAA family ATPase [Pigmentibacter ruber]